MLTGSEIKAQMVKGNIIIDPFDEDNLQPNSYDVSLGQYSYIVTVDAYRHGDWKLCKAIRNVLVPAQSVILAHTQEVFGTVDRYVAQIATKSTIARYGLDICGSAGFGDVGFVNIWTLEIHNKNDFPILLPVGRGVGQVYFSEVQGDTVDKYEGVYNSKPGDVWKPEDMLPKRLQDG